ncbi:hypothetical protein [Prevotella sp.]|uniref:hypothetical protein n=1 Tax=Prevotella sp. TaxID=59823 RepID=UPI002F95B315
MKPRKQLFTMIIACVLAVMTFFLSSCAKDSMEVYPYLNTRELTVTGKIGKDTLYSFNSTSPDINSVWIQKADGTILLNYKSENKNEIRDGQKLIGKIEYDGNTVSKIEIPDWCVITRFKRKRKQYAYAVEYFGRKNPQIMMDLYYTGGAIEIK